MECNPKGGLGCQQHLSHHLVALERVWEPLLTWAAHLRGAWTERRKSLLSRSAVLDIIQNCTPGPQQLKLRVERYQ